MVAKLRLDFDNNTRKGFDELGKSVDSSRDSLEELQIQAEKLREELEEPALEEHTEHVSDLESQYSKLAEMQEEELELQRQLVEGLDDESSATDKLVSAGGSLLTLYTFFPNQMKKVTDALKSKGKVVVANAKHLKNYRTETVATRVAMFHFGKTVLQSKHAVEIAGAGASSAAGAFLRLAGLIGAAVYVANKAVDVFQATGHQAKLMAGLTAEQAEEAEKFINRSGGSLERLRSDLAASGKSMEELGIATTDNLARSSEAVEDFSDRATEGFGQVSQAVNDWWYSMNWFMDRWDEFDASVTRGTDRFVVNMGLAGDAVDEFRGLFAGDGFAEDAQALRSLQKEHEKLAMIREREQPYYEALRAGTDAMQDQWKWAKKLADIGKLKNKSDVQGAVVNQQARFQEMLSANKLTEKEFQRHLTVLDALHQKELQISIQAEAKQKRESERVRIARKRRDARDRAYEERASSNRIAKFNAEQKKLTEQRKERQRIHDSGGAQVQSDGRTNAIIQSLDLEIERIKKIDELRTRLNDKHKQSLGEIRKREDAIHRVRTDKIEEDGRIAIRATDDAHERKMIAITTEQNLERAHAAWKMQLSNREHQDAMKKLAERFKVEQKQVELQNKVKQQLKHGGSGNKLLDDLDDKKLRDRFLENRLKDKEKEKGSELDRDEQRKERRKAMIEWGRGKSFNKKDQGKLQQEYRRAQSQEAAATLQSMQKQGNLSKEQAKVLAKATDELLKNAQELDTLTDQVKAINEALKKNATKGNRRRAQQVGAKG